MKKIWICGAFGMLGNHFQRLLNEKRIPFVSSGRNVDITNLDAVMNFVRSENISHILNCAAYTQVDLAEKEQAQAYLVNAMGPYHLGVAAKHKGAKVIHFSTDYVFDGNGKAPYDEKDLPAPVNAYGMSKLAGEMKLLEIDPRSCVIRTSWLFGTPGKNFVKTMLRLMEEKQELSVVADQVGRPTYCGDLAEAALQLLDEEGVFHFANASETTWFHFAQEIYSQAKELGLPLKMQHLRAISSHEYPTPAKRPFYSTLSTHKIEKVLRKAPRAWQEALHDYLKQILVLK